MDWEAEINALSGTVDEALRGALEECAEWDQVIVLFRRPNPDDPDVGVHAYRASKMSQGEGLWLLEQVKRMMLEDDD